MSEGPEPSRSVDQAAGYLDLYDFRVRVFKMYRERNEALVRQDPTVVWERFCQQRDALFANHPQSALPVGQRQRFSGLHYFPYNPSASVQAVLDPQVGPRREMRVGTSGEATLTMHRVAVARFVFEGNDAELAIYWIDVYGGGLFLPFRDATAPHESYGGGRYLFDTIKGSDFIPSSSPRSQSYLSSEGALPVQLDFNYAYNPSCAYDAEWVCPLAPPENRLSFRIEAGEMNFSQRKQLMRPQS